MSTTLVLVRKQDRRDRRGRRIGRNWWREFIMDSYWHARNAWEEEFEQQTSHTYQRGIIARERRLERRGGRREVTDFVEAYPPPTLKAWLLDNAGMGLETEECVA